MHIISAVVLTSLDDIHTYYIQMNSAPPYPLPLGSNSRKRRPPRAVPSFVQRRVPASRNASGCSTAWEVRYRK